MVAVGGQTRIAVVDMLGREVAVVYDGALSPGKHLLPFDTRLLPAGSYYLLLTTPAMRRAQRVDIMQ